MKAKPMGKITEMDFDRLISHLSIPDGWDDYETMCWECDLDQKKGGHCQILLNGKNVYAHRMMCVYNNNGYDPLHLETCHSCDNAKCCNPYHLQFGTRRGNTRDKVMRTHNNGTQKLKPYQVIEIKKLLLRNKLTHQQIADIYDVASRTISDINTGKTWSHLKIENK